MAERLVDCSRGYTGLFHQKPEIDASEDVPIASRAVSKSKFMNPWLDETSSV
jgi:hypothetical protein